MTTSLVPLLLVVGVARADACMPPAELVKRMPTWVGTVPYSHLKNESWGYPTDCSGFVSWALNMTHKGLFGNIVPDTVKAYQWGSTKYTKRIEYEDMRFGDVVTHVFDKLGRKCGESMGLPDDDDVESDFGYVSGHVFFFDRWADAYKNEFWAYESTQAENATAECKQLGASHCFNHHVKKERRWVLHRGKEVCDGGEYGNVTGGPQRIHGNVLCRGEGELSGESAASALVPEDTEPTDGYTVCGGGDAATNGFYAIRTPTEYVHNQSTLLHKHILHFDVIPPTGIKGPYAWELYEYDLLKAAHTKYAISVDDNVDPPTHGWQVFGNTTPPAPTVMRGARSCA